MRGRFCVVACCADLYKSTATTTTTKNDKQRQSNISAEGTVWNQARLIDIARFCYHFCVSVVVGFCCFVVGCCLSLLLLFIVCWLLLLLKLQTRSTKVDEHKAGLKTDS